jgi:hypothetical protein
MAISRASNSSLVNSFPKYNRVWDQAAGTGAMYPIATVALTSARTGIGFYDIPQTYTHLQLRVIARESYNDTGVSNGTITFNGDTTASYSYQYLQSYSGTTSAPTMTGASSYSQTSALSFIPVDSQETSTYFSPAVIDIFDYSNPNKFTTCRTLTGFDNNNNYTQLVLDQNVWYNTSAVTSMQILAYPTADFQASSHFALYGVM